MLLKLITVSLMTILLIVFIIIFRRPIVTYFTVPRLLVSPWFAGKIAIFSKDQLLLDLLYLKDTIIKKSGTLYGTPISLIKGPTNRAIRELPTVERSTFTIFFHKKIILLKFKEYYEKEGAVLLYDLWDGNNPMAITLCDSSKLAVVKSPENLIEYFYKNTEVRLSVMLILEGGDNLGFIPEGSYHLSRQLSELLNKWQHKLYHQKILNTNPLVDFYESLSKIKSYCELIMELHCEFAGIYLVDDSSFQLDLMAGLCSYRKGNRKKNKLYDALWVFLAIITSLFIGYRGWLMVRKSQLIHRAFLSDFSRPLNSDLFIGNNPIISLIAGKYNNHLRNLQYKWICNHNPTIEYKDNKEYFHNSPVETVFFIQIERDLTQLINYAKTIKYLDKDDPKTKEQYDIVYNKILEQFRIFIKQFQQHQFFACQNELLKALDHMQIHCDMTSLTNIFYNIKKMEGLCNGNSNWWLLKTINKNNKLTDIFQRLSSIDTIGPGVAEEAKVLINGQLDQLKHQTLYRRHELCGGTIVNLQEDNNIVISSGLQEFKRHILFIYHNDLLSYYNTNKLPLLADEESTIYYDLDKLRIIIKEQSQFIKLMQKINMFPPNVATVLEKLARKQLGERHFNMLTEAQQRRNSNKLKEIGENITKSVPMLRQIGIFTRTHLNYSMGFLEQHITKNTEHLGKKLKSIIENSILTPSEKLINYNGEDMLDFLFDVNSQQLPEMLDKLISEWIKIKPLIECCINYTPVNRPLHAFFTYFMFQLKSLNSPHNHINNFMRFINRLKDFKIEYTDKLVKMPKKQDFFLYMRAKYEQSIITAMNKHILNRSISQYKETLKIFKSMEGKFPFGDGTNARKEDIIKFITHIKQTASCILQDLDFKKSYKKQYESIKILQRLADTIVVNMDNLEIKLGIMYHVDKLGNPIGVHNKSYNSNLILSYETSIDSLHNFVGDTIIPTKSNLLSPFSLSISYIQEFKKQNKPPIKITKKYNYNMDRGLLRFVRDHAYDKHQSDIILKLPILIDSQDEEFIENSEKNIITYVRLINWPEIPKKLPEL